jgi:Ca2+-transporting ATPase
MLERDAHSKTAAEVADGLRSHLEAGLSLPEAQARFEKNGPNELAEKPRPGFFRLLFEQFNNFLVIILIAAAFVTVLLGEYTDAIAITVIIV